MMDWKQFDIYCAALCAWREARGEGADGMRAVLHVIANRAALRKRTWAQIVYQPLQFSSMTAPGDPQLTNVPMYPDQQFENCCAFATAIAGGGDFDLTNGATNYYATSIPEPQWAKSMTQTTQIGRQVFFK